MFREIGLIWRIPANLPRPESGSHKPLPEENLAAIRAGIAHKQTELGLCRQLIRLLVAENRSIKLPLQADGSVTRSVRRDRRTARYTFDISRFGSNPEPDPLRVNGFVVLLNPRTGRTEHPLVLTWTT